MVNINFLENNNYNELRDFLQKELGFSNIKYFTGNLNENNFPIGKCIVKMDEQDLENDVENIELSINKDTRLIKECFINLKNGSKIEYRFTGKNFGEIIYPDASIYEGGVKKLMKHGHGVCVTSQGYEMAGTFINDLRNGRFKVKFQDEKTAEINYVNDLAEGYFEKELNNGAVLCGVFEKNKITELTYFIESKDIMIEMEDINENVFYEITGHGSVFENNRLIYTGYLKNGTYHGEGAYIYANGGKFVGFFKDGKKDGEGILFDENGTILIKGVWKNGNLIESIYVSDLMKDRIDKTGKITSFPDAGTSLVTSLEVESKPIEMDIVYLKNAIKNIEKNIVGQKQAINEISNNLLLSFLCEREENKPLTSIIMTGPTGVGKTETAKQISENIFKTKPFVVDFANFYGEHMLASLIGAPNGYIGADQTPELLKYISENQEKGGVLLFEEIDKSDAECLNIFMRMLDEGEILSAKNQPYSVKNFVILATTNMSVNHVRSLGFSSENKTDVKDELANKNTGMKREQIARFDLVVEYKNLTRKDKITLCKKAIEDTIKKLKTLKGYNITYEYDNSIIESIVDNTNSVFGVREIKRQASKQISEKLAEFIRKNDATNITVKINSLDDIKVEDNNKKLKVLEKTN